MKKRYQQLRKSWLEIKKKYSTLNLYLFNQLLQIQAKVHWASCDWNWHGVKCDIQLYLDCKVLRDNSHGLLDNLGGLDNSYLLDYINKSQEIVAFEKSLNEEINALIIDKSDSELLEWIMCGNSYQNYSEKIQIIESNEKALRRAQYEELKKEFDK